MNSVEHFYINYTVLNSQYLSSDIGIHFFYLTNLLCSRRIFKLPTLYISYNIYVQKPWIVICNVIVKRTAQQHLNKKKTYIQIDICVNIYRKMGAVHENFSRDVTKYKWNDIIILYTYLTYTIVYIIFNELKKKEDNCLIIIM